MSVTAWCERALALLAAGLPSQRVIELLGAAPITRADGGAVRIAWDVCVHYGSALSAVLVSCIEASRDWERIARDRDAAIAGPRSAARLVSLLPVVALAMGAALGFNTMAVLFGSVVGWLCLVIGAVFMVISLRWTKRLVRRASEWEPAPGFACELSAQLMSSGISAASARSEVDRVWPGEHSARDEALEFAQRSGMPPARALRAEAAAQRADAAGTAELLAAELGVKLTLPLGVCVLPAFVCWGVVPMFLSVLGSTAGTLR